MAIKIVGYSGNVAEVDGNGNLLTKRKPSDSASFCVAGGPSAVVAASLAASTTLMSFRHGPAALTVVDITRIRVCMSTATAGTGGTGSGYAVLQRFTGATPSGGTARTPVKKGQLNKAGTQVIDVRDSNAALTVTGVNFGDIVCLIPIGGWINTSAEVLNYDLKPSEYIRLYPGEGIAFRTPLAGVGPATFTWTYTYSIHYLEE